MISYPKITNAEILARVNARSPKWLQRAADKTAELVEAGGFSSTGSRKRKGNVKGGMWSEIKMVFMELQNYKCIFCERALAKQEGAIEHDVDHYRPKNRVTAWIAPKGKRKVTHKVGPASTTGYYWLAYDLQNYAAACKVCNSTKKRNYFPIHGTRGQPVQDVPTLNVREQPLLLFPLIEDPSNFITFSGIIAVPLHKSGFQHFRAEVTIALFNLNGREELWSDRFGAISAVFHAFETLNCGSSQVKRDDALVTLAELTSERSPQSACAKAYLNLLCSDPDKAWLIYQDARNSIR